MSKTKISEFSTTPGNNTDINGINIAEGCAPSGINNAIRELMSDLKEWQSGAMDVYVIPQGTVAAPGIQLYGDLDTGLYGFAANQLGVAVGGASAGYFSSAGWVGNVVATTVDLTNIEVTNIKAKDGTTSVSLADSTGIATFSKATVIETTDNTNAALRITQLGTGNALLVEDATNPDTTPTVIDQFGNVILGTTARTTPITSKIEIHGTASELSGLSPSLGFYHWSATASLSSTLTFRHYPSGTVGTLAANTSGDVLGRIVFLSYDGTNSFGAVIRGVSGTGGTAPSITYDASGGHNFTNGPIDVETLEVTNIKARDGTAAASIADSTGVITVTKDVIVNGVTLGKGLGSVLTNTALGRSALAANMVGDLNTAVGNLSLTSNTGGTGNTAVGHVAMTSHQGGSLNTAVGAGSLTANLNGNNNTAIGQSALGTATGSNNTAVGSAAGSLITNGNKNTIIGNYDGNQGGLDIRTASNYIVLSDGDGNPRAYWNGANATFGGSLTATTITGTQVNSDNLRLDGNTLSSTDTNGNIVVTPNGTGITTFSNYLKTGNLEVGQVALGTNLIKATNTNGGIYLQTNGTGLIFADAASIIAGNASATTKITTNGASDLVLDTNDGSNSGSITIEDGVNGNIIIAPNGTGQVQITNAALDLTTIEVTNIKAKDGTASITLADSTGNVTVSPAFAVNGNTTLGNASTDTVTVNGYMGVGGSTDSSMGVYLRNNALTGTSQRGFYSSITGTSAATSAVDAFLADPKTAAASYTVTNVRGFLAADATKGAGSTITNQHGVYVADQTQGTNNYGITSLVSSGTNKWNIYASGTAANYFAGNVGIGDAVSGSLWTSMRALNVGRRGNSVFGSVSDDEINIGANVINTGSGTYIYGENDTASLYRQVAAQHVWYTGAAGTAGAALTLTERARLTQSEAVFNDPGNDYDFRVESDTNTHALFVQGSDGFVGIGASAPDYKTTIVESNTGAASTLLAVHNSGTAANTEARIALAGGNGLTTRHAYIGAINGGSSGGNPHSLVFATNAASASPTERLRITSAGNVSIGGTADRATTVGTKALNIFDGTAPVGTLANGISLYSSSGEAYVMDAAGNATLFSPHDAETNEWIFKSKHTPTGKVLKIDVEKMLRFINDHFGLDAIHEFTEE